MSAEAIVGYIIATSAVIGAIIAFLQWRSKGIFVEPQVLNSLQKRADNLTDRLDIEEAKRRALAEQLDEASEKLDKANEDAKKLSERLDSEIKKREELQEKAREDRSRILSLEQNDVMNQKYLGELRNKLEEWQKGIDILIDQIEKKHSSEPDWRPDE